ncbi:hypothetical protein [Lewinella sp. LCG006]|uniref:hypothetical protein n=1 Tax=Lewinella sp. LCG006 TaxID=3231911 RepID=UPI00345FD85C
MNIIKIVVEPSEDQSGWYLLSVAIISRPGYWKAYRKSIGHYPTLADAQHVANTGSKIHERWQAEQVFGIKLSLDFEA